MRGNGQRRGTTVVGRRPVRRKGVRSGPGHGLLALLAFRRVDGPPTAHDVVPIVPDRRRVRRRAAGRHIGRPTEPVLQRAPGPADGQQTAVPVPPGRRRRLAGTDSPALRHRRRTRQVRKEGNDLEPPSITHIHITYITLFCENLFVCEARASFIQTMVHWRIS